MYDFLCNTLTSSAQVNIVRMPLLVALAIASFLIVGLLLFDRSNPNLHNHITFVASGFSQSRFSWVADFQSPIQGFQDKLLSALITSGTLIVVWLLVFASGSQAGIVVIDSAEEKFLAKLKEVDWDWQNDSNYFTRRDFGDGRRVCVCRRGGTRCNRPAMRRSRFCGLCSCNGCRCSCADCDPSSDSTSEYSYEHSRLSWKTAVLQNQLRCNTSFLLSEVV